MWKDFHCCASDPAYTGEVLFNKKRVGDCLIGFAIIVLVAFAFPFVTQVYPHDQGIFSGLGVWGACMVYTAGIVPVCFVFSGFYFRSAREGWSLREKIGLGLLVAAGVVSVFALFLSTYYCSGADATAFCGVPNMLGAGLSALLTVVGRIVLPRTSIPKV